MRKRFFLVISVFFFFFLYSETVDVSTSIPATATLLGTAEITVNVRNVSDNSIVSTVTWTNIPSTTTYKEASQYIEVQYNDNYYSWAIRVYTDNDNWGGSWDISQGGGGGGLIHNSTNTIRLPLLWRVYDEVQAGGVPCSDATNWAYVKDDNDSDWGTAKTTYANICYGGADYTNLADYPSSGRSDADLQDVYIYLGAHFGYTGTSGDYSGNIYIDIFRRL